MNLLAIYGPDEDDGEEEYTGCKDRAELELVTNTRHLRVLF